MTPLYDLPRCLMGCYHCHASLCAFNTEQGCTTEYTGGMISGNCDWEGEEENRILAEAPGRQYKPHDV